MPSSSPEDRDQQLLSIGKQCSDPTCLLIDFLPFTCQHCEQPFCGDHFMVAAHRCPKYDESKYNRVAPNCPLCNEPVAIRPGQDPNVRMEDHFAKECSVMTGKSGKTKSAPVCARVKCGKVLFAPIRCDKCKEQFCPAHRFPADHNCSVPAIVSISKATASEAAKNMNTKASAATAATVGAIKRNLASVGQSSSPGPPPPAAPKSPITGKSSRPSSHVNPFSKADRRAKAERESRRKAMHERAKKGLLSEEEKTILAEEEAKRAQHGREKRGDCLIM